MKTITYNPETHVLVPREPLPLQLQDGSEIDLAEETPEAYQEFLRDIYLSMIAAASQPEPNHNWCAGCSPDNCSGCWNEHVVGIDQVHSDMIDAAPQPEPVESEPAMWVMKHIRSGDLAQAKPNQKALHPRMWSQAHLYTTPQPDRVAELEAALKVARDGIDEFLVANDPTEFGCACDLSVGYLCGPCHADKQQQPLKSALAKINEALHD